MEYDVIIIGGGAAGMTAAIYTTRRAMKTMVISQDIGGQAATTPDVENYPGFESINGFELMQRFKQQAEKNGAEFVIEEVKRIERADDQFRVILNTAEYHSKTVILAFGLTHRHLGVPGEDELIGRGVSYCATCDGPLYRGKDAAVVGGGSSALDAAFLLARIAHQVYLIHRRDRFTGEAVLADRLKQAKNLTVLYNTVVTEIKGDKAVTHLVVKGTEPSAPQRTLAVNGVFVEIGFQVKADFIKGLVDLDSNNQVVVSKDGETSVPGIFGAGDVTDSAYKQIIISAGEGAKAALQAFRYLAAGKVGGVGVDWGKKKL